MEHVTKSDVLQKKNYSQFYWSWRHSRLQSSTGILRHRGAHAATCRARAGSGGACWLARRYEVVSRSRKCRKMGESQSTFFHSDGAAASMSLWPSHSVQLWGKRKGPSQKRVWSACQSLIQRASAGSRCLARVGWGYAAARPHLFVCTKARRTSDEAAISLLSLFPP